MGYKVKKNESVGAGIRRVAREEIEEALDRLDAGKADPEKTVHELRKHFKRLRAVARLVRADLGAPRSDRSAGRRP